MKKSIYTITAVAVAFGLSACGAATTATPPSAPASSTVASAPAAPTDAATTEAAPTAPSTTSCDAAREAFLTGTPKTIRSSLLALKADKTANATAREYADYYVNRDASDNSLQEMDKGLINMSCTS